MENQRYKNLLQKAKNNELTSNDINEVVLAWDESKRNLEQNVSLHGKSIREIEEEYPLLPPEADDLSNAVKKKGVRLMGGKSSPAYQNENIRKQVYRDIYSEIKRQYGLFNERGGQLSYKKLKRKYLPGAFMVVENYILPTTLEEAIQTENDLEDVL